MPVSAIIIAKNEKNNIKECMDSLGFAQEIIVIDNGSTDGTADRAHKTGATVYEHTGLDFSSLRNLGHEKAKNNWLLYIDADEKVSGKLAEEITQVTAESHDYSAYKIIRQNYFLGRRWPKTEQMVRLIKKSALVGWQGRLHESPHIKGEIGSLHNVLNHYAHRNIREMVEKTNQWSEIEAQLRYQNHHPWMSWWRFFRVMLSAFIKSYFMDRGYQAGTEGLIESIYQTFSIFITYAKLWEKQQRDK